MTTTISVKEQVRDELLKIAAELQMKERRKVDLNDAIEYLIARKTKRPDLLDRACRPISDSPERSSFDATYKELIEERKRDEERSKRRHGV